MVTATVTTIRTKTAFPTKTSLAMNFAKTPAFITPTTTVKPSPITLQAIVNPLTKVSLPGTTIPKTKVVVPLENKGIVEGLQTIGKAGSSIGGALQYAPFGAIGLFIGGLQSVLSPTKTTTTAPKTGVNTLNVRKTQAEIDAYKLASQVKLGQWYKQKSPTLLPTIAMMKTKSVLGLIGASGYEVNPKGTSGLLTQFRDALNLAPSQEDIANTQALYDNLFNKYIKETGEQTAYIGELSTALQTLQASSIEGSIWKAKYEATWQQLQDLLAGGGGGNGNGNGTTPTDWKSLILYGALAIGGIIVLWALLKGRGK